MVHDIAVGKCVLPSYHCSGSYCPANNYSNLFPRTASKWLCLKHTSISQKPWITDYGKKKKDNFPNQTRRNKLNNVSGAEEAKQNPHACPPLCLLRGATLPGMYPSLELGII